jgi:hypothetical protein
VLESRILQIHRDRVKAGCEAAFRDVEERAARICAELGCPHPHLAVESIGDPGEVWWLNGFDSEEHRQRITDAYLSNAPLMSAFEHVRTGREGLLDLDEDIFANYNAGLSRGGHWTLSTARFLVITITNGPDLPEGAVFDAGGSMHFVFKPASRVEQAEQDARAAGHTARIFAIRPYWGFPAREWIAADLEFWKPNPIVMAR